MTKNSTRPAAEEITTSNERRVFFVINAKAGKCDAEDIPQQLEDSLANCDFEWDTFCRTKKGQSRKKATRKALKDGFDTIVAVGGDGTVSKVGNAIATWNGDQTESVTLGIVPTGTANLLARSLHVPLDVADAIELIKDPPPPRPLDGMRLGKRMLFSHISLGTYSRIAKQESDAQKEWLGRGAYVWNLVQEVRQKNDWQFELSIDGQRETVEASLIMIANIGATGIGEMQWGTDIRPDDGVIDICLISATGLAEYGRLVWQALRGDPEAADVIEYRTVRKHLSVTASDPKLPVRADGKLRGKGTVEIKVVPGALSVIAPPSATTEREIDG